MTVFSRLGQILSGVFFAILRIVLESIPAVFGIVILCFLLLQLVPGDMADAMAAEAGSATAETMAAMREHFGLDQPVISQLITYLLHLATLDLGVSHRFNASVLSLVTGRLPATLLLMGTAIVFALLIGVAVGWLQAIYRGRIIDRALSVIVLFFYSTPGFWMGLMAIILFSVSLGWLPDQGDRTIGVDLEGFALITDRLRHLVLPALAMAAFYVAVYARLARATVLEIQPQDYIRTALAKGISPATIQLRHVLRNALIPITTMAGLHVANMLGGSVVIETVFGWPGMGRLALEAVQGRDFNLLLGVLLMSSLLVIVTNIVVDLLQRLIDPRIS